MEWLYRIEQHSSPWVMLSYKSRSDCGSEILSMCNEVVKDDICTALSRDITRSCESQYQEDTNIFQALDIFTRVSINNIPNIKTSKFAICTHSHHLRIIFCLVWVEWSRPLSLGIFHDIFQAWDTLLWPADLCTIVHANIWTPCLHPPSFLSWCKLFLHH